MVYGTLFLYTNFNIRIDTREVILKYTLVESSRIHPHKTFTGASCESTINVYCRGQDFYIRTLWDALTKAGFNRRLLAA